jgi:hypothetical protein
MNAHSPGTAGVDSSTFTLRQIVLAERAFAGHFLNDPRRTPFLCRDSLAHRENNGNGGPKWQRGYRQSKQDQMDNALIST